MSTPFTSLKLGRGKYSYLVGVQWDYAPSKKEAKTKAKNLKRPLLSKIFVAPNTDNSWLIGLSHKKIDATFMAAPIFAQMVGTGIIRHKLSDGRTWLLACVKGAVIPFHDVLVTVGDDDLLALWADEIQSDNIVEFENSDWAKLDDFCDALASSQKNPYYIKRPINIKLMSIATLAGAALTIGALIAYSIYDKHQSSPHQPVLLSPEQRRAAFEKMMTDKAEFERLALTKQQAFASANAASEVLALLHALDQTPSPFAYASVSKLHCTTSETTDWTCLPTWNISPELGLLAKAHVSTATTPQEVIQSHNPLQGSEIRLNAVLPTPSQINTNPTITYQGPWELWLRDDFHAFVGHQGIQVQWAEPTAVRHYDPALPDMPPVDIGVSTQLTLRIVREAFNFPPLLNWLNKYPSKLMELTLEGTITTLGINIHLPSSAPTSGILPNVQTQL